MSASASGTPGVKPPRLWKYLLGEALALLILIPAWTLIVMLVIQPESLMQEQETLSKQHWLWWVGIPVVAVAAFFGWRWMAASSAAAVQATQADPKAQADAAAQARREYVLEVISLGVTLDHYRQGALWDALKQGHPYASIREQDPKKYPWSEQEKEQLEGGREAHTLENGAKFIVQYWGMPAFFAGPPLLDPEKQRIEGKEPIAGMVTGAISSGMAWHLFVSAPGEESERPDQLLDKVFDFFDKHPEVPFVLLPATDGLYVRNLFRVPGTPPSSKTATTSPKCLTPRCCWCWPGATGWSPCASTNGASRSMRA